MTPRLRWSRQQAGRYLATDHHGWLFEACSIEFHTEGASRERAWHLTRQDPDPMGCQDTYWNTFATLADAKRAAQGGLDELTACGRVSW